MQIPRNVVLADSEFHVSREIDMLIGAGLFWEIILPAQLSTGHNNPSLQLSWVVAGDIINTIQSNSLGMLSLCK